MAYEIGYCRDEGGALLMDYDECTQSDESHQHLRDDEDGAHYDRPPIPVYKDPKAIPQKRSIKNSSGKDELSDGGKRKRGEGEKSTSAEKKSRREKIRDHKADRNPEDDREGTKTVDDDNFVDDSGVGPSERFGSGNEHSPSRAPQAVEGEEEVDEIEELSKSGKKKDKNRKTADEITLLVEEVMAELEVAAEEDHVLNTQEKPAINKLKKLPLLTGVLAKKQLQQKFLDHGVLTLLKNWLEPLPDKSLPNFNIRSAVLNILKELPIDLDQFDRREQLKKSGIGKVVMFLSKSNEEKTINQKLAQELVDKWSRSIFDKSTRFEDMKNFEDERVFYRRPSVKKVTSKATERVSQDDDLDLVKISQFRRQKSGQTSSSQHALRPEAMSMDFVLRPQSKFDPSRSNKQTEQNPHRLKVMKKLQKLKALKRKPLQATKVSVEGRGMVKYL